MWSRPNQIIDDSVGTCILCNKPVTQTQGFVSNHIDYYNTSMKKWMYSLSNKSDVNVVAHVICPHERTTQNDNN
jgi:hypothetical protein